MRQKRGPHGSAEKTVKDTRRATRKRHATEEKIHIAPWLTARLILQMTCGPALADSKPLEFRR